MKITIVKIDSLDRPCAQFYGFYTGDTTSTHQIDNLIKLTSLNHYALPPTLILCRTHTLWTWRNLL